MIRKFMGKVCSFSYTFKTDYGIFILSFTTPNFMLGYLASFCLFKWSSNKVLKKVKSYLIIFFMSSSDPSLHIGPDLHILKIVKITKDREISFLNKIAKSLQVRNL